MKKYIRNIQGKAKLFSQHQGVRKHSFNISWLLAEKIARIISGLFVGAYVARYLGPSQFGLLSYVVSFVALFGALASLGLDQIVVRELVKDESRRDVLLGTTFVLRIIGALFVLLFVTITLQFMEGDALTRTLIYIIVVGVVLQIFNVIDFFFQAKVWSKYTAWTGLGALIISAILKVWFVWLEKPLIWFVAMVVLDTAIIVLGLIFFYFKNKLSIFRWKFQFATAKQLLKNSWPLILSGVTISIYMRIDQIMIKNMLGNVANGQYAVAVRLSELWYFVPMAICGSLFPAIVNAKKIREQLYHNRLQRLHSLMIWIAIAIALPTTFLSGWVINLLYGSAYSQAATVLSIHIWAGVFVFLGVSVGLWLMSENYMRISMYRTLMGAAVNIILNIVLIPVWGIVGVAMATLISYAVSAYFSLLVFSKTRSMFVYIFQSILPLKMKP